MWRAARNAATTMLLGLGLALTPVGQGSLDTATAPAGVAGGPVMELDVSPGRTTQSVGNQAGGAAGAHEPGAGGPRNGADGTGSSSSRLAAASTSSVTLTTAATATALAGAAGATGSSVRQPAGATSSTLATPGPRSTLPPAAVPPTALTRAPEPIPHDTTPHDTTPHDTTPATEPPQTTTAPPPVERHERPLLIKHGWDLPRPGWIRDHAAEMEQLGFDGVVTTLDQLSGRINSQVPVSYAEIRAALSPLEDVEFRSMTHNFLIVYRGDYRIFDDNTVPLANFANLARAAREVGLEGIVFDNESYDGPSWKWPEAAPGATLAEAQAQAQRRGRETMAAMTAEWPDVTVLAMYGPWVSDPATASFWNGSIPYNDIAWANQLMGPFTVGLVEASVGTQATVVDGGELYSLRTPAQFDLAYRWLDAGFAANSALVPDALRAAYGATVSVGFGVYDRPAVGQPMDAALWQTTLAAALSRTDRYVWAYTEEYDWWGTGWPSSRVPPAWVDATRAAVESAASS